MQKLRLECEPERNLHSGYFTFNIDDKPSSMTSVCEQKIVSYSCVLLKHIKHIIIFILVSTIHYLIFFQFFFLVWVGENKNLPISATTCTHTHTCTCMYIHTAVKLLLNLFIMIALDCVSIKYYLGPAIQKFS